MEDKMKSDKKETLGTKFREIRLKKELSQLELAKRMGVTQGYISRIENDLTTPTVEFLFKMRKKFKVNLNSLLCL